MAVSVAQAKAGVGRFRRAGVWAFAGYALVAFLVFGVRLLVEPGGRYLGYLSDPKTFIWCFAWWPYAILHGENPFVTHAIWAPSGVNLTWTASVPGLALLFSPLTLIAGPVVSYNVATVLLPALAAWTAFLLCRHLTDSLWASLVAGYLFGFSSYVLGQEEGHPHMTAVFLVPLVALVVVRYLEGGLGGRALVLWLGPLLGFELLISTEVTFTLGLALGVGVVLGVLLLPRLRGRIASMVVPLIGGYAFAAVLTSPFLYYALTGYQSIVFHPHSGTLWVSDLLNFVVPTKLALLSVGWADGISSHFPGNDSERDAYLGVPLLLIVALFFRSRVRTAGGRFLLAGFVVAAVASLGAKLTIDGHQGIALPWSVVQNWPMFDNVLPSRLAMYVSLLAAVAVALWVAAQKGWLRRVALPALAVYAVVPNPASGVWASRYSVPAFFTSSTYSACIRPGETILPLPPVYGAQAMLWQVEANFRFSMAGGDIAPAPPEQFLEPRAIQLVSYGASDHGSAAPSIIFSRAQAPDFREFIADKDVSAVLVDPTYAANWSRPLEAIARPRRLGGMLVYAVSADAPSCVG